MFTYVYTISYFFFFSLKRIQLYCKSGKCQSLLAETLCMAPLPLVLPAVCHKGWMTPLLWSQVTLWLDPPQIMPQTSVMFSFQRGALRQADLSAIAFLEEGRKLAPVTFEKKPPFPWWPGGGWRASSPRYLSLYIWVNHNI